MKLQAMSTRHEFIFDAVKNAQVNPEDGVGRPVVECF